MLDEYIQYLEQNEGQSLLTRIYGLYSFKTWGLEEIDLIIMQNSSNLINKSKRVYEFDIKGSLKGRKSKDMKGTLKDLDLLEIQSKEEEMVVDL
jgi:hypothetical protein